MAGGNKMPDLKIAFDQQVFLLQEYGGISRYLCCVADEFQTMPGVEAGVFAPLHFNRSLASLPKIPGRGVLLPKVPTKLFRLVSAASQQIARAQMRGFRPDILHETYYTHDDFLPRGARRVVTVYDMISERFAVKHGDRTTTPKRAAVERADHVICISENTRRDLMEILGVPERKTSVIYLAAGRAFQDAEVGDQPWAGPEMPFVLHVGGRGNYKNFKAFIQAFASSSFLKKNFAIVCFGGGPLSIEETAHAAGLGIDSSRLVYRTGGDTMLVAYYRKAAALIYPSLYEGFGIPPLEAMACSCPVICSKTSSLPEVVGDAGEYFDPENQDEMAGAMERVLESSPRIAELIKLGKARCAKYRWDKCAHETLEVYKKLL